MFQGNCSAPNSLLTNYIYSKSSVSQIQPDTSYFEGFGAKVTRKPTQRPKHIYTTIYICINLHLRS